MKIDIRNKKHLPFAKYFRVFNADTGQEIPKVVWADVANGEYGQYLLDSDGKVYFEEGMTELEVYTKRGNIELRCR